MPVAFPPVEKTSFTPASAMAFRMAAKVAAIGVCRPFSKSRTVDNDTFARLARSSCDQPNHPRAARLCSGLIDIKRYEFLMLISTEIVENTHDRLRKMIED